MFALGGSLLLEEEEEEERGKGGEEGKEEEKGGGRWKSGSRLIKSWTKKFEETVTKPTHNVQNFRSLNLGNLSLTYREMGKAACLFPFGF